MLLSQTLICVILLLGQLHGYKSCIQKERKALFELKQYLISISVEWALDSVLPTWTNDSKSDCCRWDGIKCNHTGGRVIGIFISKTSFKERSPLNLYLLHPFEDVRILNFSGRSNQFSGLFGAFHLFFSSVLVYPCVLCLETFFPALEIKILEGLYLIYLF